VLQETALEMIHTIREAFNELLADNDWMDDETRAVAKQKADAMNERIGYPELLTDEDELTKEYVMVRHLGLISTPSGNLNQQLSDAFAPFRCYVDFKGM
jgi:hypothetical protein